ncbi:hypothetical protein AMTRI_Chr12g242090 [Amborella trichopoda]
MLHCRSAVAPKTSLSEQTPEAHIFIVGVRSQNARALWVRQMTTGVHIGTTRAQFLVCRSVVGQTKHYWSAHCDCQNAHSDCRKVVLYCRSVVALEASVPEWTAGACDYIARASYQNARAL